MITMGLGGKHQRFRQSPHFARHAGTTYRRLGAVADEDAASISQRPPACDCHRLRRYDRRRGSSRCNSRTINSYFTPWVSRHRTAAPPSPVCAGPTRSASSTSSGILSSLAEKSGRCCPVKVSGKTPSAVRRMGCSRNSVFRLGSSAAVVDTPRAAGLVRAIVLASGCVRHPAALPHLCRLHPERPRRKWIELWFSTKE